MSSLEKISGLTDNQCKIIDVLLKKGEITKGDIAKEFGMKLTSLNNILYPMREQGIVMETVLAESSGGRRPTLYSIPKEEYLVIGIDISILYVKVILANIRMEILYREEFPMDETCTPQKTFDVIAGIIKRILSEYDPENRFLLGIGIGSVGALDAQNDLLAENVAFQAPGWKNVRLKAMLEERLPYKVIIENGVNCAVLLEYLYGSGKEHKNIAYFNCGIGIRVGTIQSAKIIRSLNDEEEAFSKMQLFLPGNLEDSHCIEEYITIKSINKNYLEKKGEKATEEAIYSIPLFRKIAREIEEGDEIAEQVVDQAANIMGVGIANFVRLMNSDLIILGGPLIENCPRFYSKCRESVMKNLEVQKAEFDFMGRFGNDAIALGAAAMFVETLLRCFY